MQYVRLFLELIIATVMSVEFYNHVRWLKARRHALNEFSDREALKYTLPMMWMTMTSIFGVISMVLVQELMSVSLYALTPGIAVILYFLHIPFLAKKKKWKIEKYEITLFGGYLVLGMFIQLVLNQVYKLVELALF